MAKRKIILPVAIIAVIAVAVVGFAACAPSSYSTMSPALQDYYGDYGEYYNNIVKSGRVRYRDAETGLYGYLDSGGNVAIPAKYTSARAFGDGFAAVALDGNYALIDEDGNVIAGYFDSVTATPAGVIVLKDGKYGVYNKDGEVLPVVYDGITANYSTYIIERDGKYGLASLSGEVLIQPQYDEAMSVSEDSGGYADSGGMTAFYDSEDQSTIYADVKGAAKFTSYKDEYIVYLGFDKYLRAEGNSIKICGDDLSTIECELPEKLIPIAYNMLDEERITVQDEITDATYVYNLKTGERSVADLRAYIGGSSDIGYRVYIALEENGTYNVYFGGKTVLALQYEELANTGIVSGTFRDYAYNTMTNTLTDLLTGEQLTLSREIVDVTAAEEGMFAVENAAGDMAVCAKNGDMLSPFCYDSVNVMADGFIGVRNVNGKSVYEWRGFDGNLILRTAEMRIYAN